VLTAPVLAEVVRAMVMAWEPDWGVVTSGDFRDSVSQEGDVGTFVGWMTYISAQRGAVPALPAPVRVASIEDEGALIQLTSERISAANPGQVALARDVQGVLRANGLLEPVSSTGAAS
jgi:hypothetical protein